MGALLDEVRQAIADSPMTSYEIAKKLGVAHSTIYRLANGTRKSISLETLEAICTLLGLELRRKRGTR